MDESRWQKMIGIDITKFANLVALVGALDAYLANICFLHMLLLSPFE